MASLADATPPIALGALDGRYRGVVAPLVDHLSEPALNRERVHVEVEWLIHLTDAPGRAGRARASPTAEQEALRAGRRGLRRRPRSTSWPRSSGSPSTTSRRSSTSSSSRLTEIAPAPEDRGLAELIHFCCTSEDINNLSYALMVKGAVAARCGCPARTALVEAVATMASDLREVPLLAHTHGQPATPTTMGKELAVLAHRLQRQLRRIERRRVPRQAQRRDRHLRRARRRRARGRLAGGQPRRSSRASACTWNPLTTQIESHDWQAELYADVARFNRVLHNLCTDVWTYISLGYFAQVRGQGTVGSSTMPHKVNPIRFENAEANLEVSQRPARRARRRRWSPAGCSATSPTPRCSATSASAFGHSLLAHRQRRARARRARRRARGDGRRPRRQLGGARRAGAVGHAGPRAPRACRAWTSPTSGSRS